jgi:hypothetical protein
MDEQEAKLHQEVSRAERARELLEDPMMLEAMESLRAQYLAAWENSPARDPEAREKIWTYLKALDKVKGHLLEVMETGMLAREQLTQESLMKKALNGLSGFVR